jgi:hypothetical protein
MGLMIGRSRPMQSFPAKDLPSTSANRLGSQNHVVPRSNMLPHLHCHSSFDYHLDEGVFPVERPNDRRQQVRGVVFGRAQANRSNDLGMHQLADDTVIQAKDFVSVR